MERSDREMEGRKKKVYFAHTTKESQILTWAPPHRHSIQQEYFAVTSPHSQPHSSPSLSLPPSPSPSSFSVLPPSSPSLPPLQPPTTTDFRPKEAKQRMRGEGGRGKENHREFHASAGIMPRAGVKAGGRGEGGREGRGREKDRWCWYC